MTEKQPIGLLFDSISYNSVKDLNSLCDEINLEQSYYMVIKALEFAHKSGVYTLQESEIVSKSLRVLNKHFTEQPEE